MHDLQFFIDLRSSINLLRQRHVGTHMFEKQYQALNMLIETAKTTENGTFIVCPICGDELIPGYEDEEEDHNDGDNLICPICNGLGEDPRTDKICTSCHGQGWKGEGHVEDE